MTRFGDGGTSFTCRLVVLDVGLEARAQLLLRLRTRQREAFHEAYPVFAHRALDEQDDVAFVGEPIHFHAPVSHPTGQKALEES